MPQPKSTKSAPKSRKRSVVNPVDAVLLTRERLQEILDDAVERGRMTRSDATELVTQIFSIGRRTTEDIIGDVEQLLGRSRDNLEGRARREVDRARRATGIGGSFPIGGYDELTAAQVQSRLDDLSPAQLRKVRDYERRNANRKTVLAAIEQKLGS